MRQSPTNHDGTSLARSAAGTPDDASLISEAPFTIDGDLRDIKAFAFLAGIRDNDLKGHAPTDTTSLATVHGNPNGQREHCLRRSENDEPNGTLEVIAECRAWIEELLDNAIDAGPDSSSRTRLAIYLAYSGEVDAMLPVFYVYMGQALHAVQDSFTHMYRTGDGRRRRAPDPTHERRPALVPRIHRMTLGFAFGG
jgi:hypothetical protein